eukprot:1149951-Rhodomonas_salina.1
MKAQQGAHVGAKAAARLGRPASRITPTFAVIMIIMMEQNQISHRTSGDAWTPGHTACQQSSDFLPSAKTSSSRVKKLFLHFHFCWGRLAM